MVRINTNSNTSDFILSDMGSLAVLFVGKKVTLSVIKSLLLLIHTKNNGMQKQKKKCI